MNVDLKELLGNEYKITFDESYKAEKDKEARAEKWRYYEVCGKKGKIYPYSAQMLAIYLQDVKVDQTEARFIRKQGWRIIQNGDWEIVALFPASDLQKALPLIEPKKCRILTEVQKIIMAGRLAVARSQKSYRKPPLLEGSEAPKNVK